MKDLLPLGARTLIGLAVGLLGLALACALSAHTLEHLAGAENYRVGERERNPYFAPMAEIAARHDVDLEHARTLKRGRAFELSDSPLFQLQDHELDVLIVGDSTAVWGFSPPILSKVSEKRVGIFAYGQAHPTRDFLRTVRTLATTYLAKDGIILLCFSPQGWDHPLNTKQSSSSLQKITGKRDEQLLRFIANKRAPSLFSAESMAVHWARVETAVDRLPLFQQATLPDLAFYATWIEPLIAPKTAKAARENADDREQSFYLWDEWNSILAVCSDCEYQDPRSTLPKGKKPTARMRAAAAQARQLPYRLGFVITYYADAYRSAKLRGLYQRELQQHVALVDIEAMWPAGLKVANHSGSHVFNEGALHQSLLLGYWLKRVEQGDLEPNRQAPL